MAIIGITLNSVKTYKISPLYAVLYPLGSIFLVIAYLASIIPLLLPLRKNSSKKTIQWKGRIYTYKRRGGSMIWYNSNIENLFYVTYFLSDCLWYSFYYFINFITVNAFGKGSNVPCKIVIWYHILKLKQI